ncbi:hypothetical protein SLEP1_g24676 [Rubroshorea leprosula]|uniref:DNA2/NAM7 helicase-like C-terminal domain-containing protein n=1 Tax=Rubroshorea leprosula TaxID=152421 RepID=A0AAV5JTP2_9ROSI|nr:hypothetical protein SLEP1_g24676 [Rubroshorea leprosula]
MITPYAAQVDLQKMLRSNEDINWEIDVLRPCCTHSPSVGARACDGLWKVSMSGKSKPNDQVEEERVGTVAKYWHLFLKGQGSIMSRPQLTTVTCGLYMVSTLRTQGMILIWTMSQGFF